MKNKIFRKIFFLLTIAISALSCGKALLIGDDINILNGKKGILIISGIVSDRETNSPLEGIQVSFQCDAENFEKMSVFSNDDGIFIIKAEGFTTALNGCINVRDLDGKFQPITRNIIVDWKGESYDPKTGRFAINDCNFQLQRL